tara:strand:+ start:619 stop:981 length:363 start_codon:yes stop_codon:yes gene_type:complete
MTKKEFKKLKKGDKLIVTGSGVPVHYYPIDELVILLDKDRYEGAIGAALYCESTRTGDKQWVSIKDLELVERTKAGLEYKFFKTECNLCIFVNDNKVKVVSISYDGDDTTLPITLFYKKR